MALNVLHVAGDDTNMHSCSESSTEMFLKLYMLITWTVTLYFHVMTSQQ